MAFWAATLGSNKLAILSFRFSTALFLVNKWPGMLLQEAMQNKVAKILSAKDLRFICEIANCIC